jgi:hypothetical protein
LYEAIVGERVMETLQKDHTVSYLDLLREFETVKRNIKVGVVVAVIVW